MNRINHIKAQRRASSKYLRRWNPDVKPKESKLDPVVKEKWLTALRSGEYKQAKHALRKDRCDGSSFCCLGVLTDILDPDGWQKSRSTRFETTRTHKFKGSKYPNDMFPNQNAMRDVGLYKTAWMKLSELNDEGHSFAAIADHIEKNL